MPNPWASCGLSCIRWMRLEMGNPLREEERRTIHHSQVFEDSGMKAQPVSLTTAPKLLISDESAGHTAP